MISVLGVQLIQIRLLNQLDQLNKPNQLIQHNKLNKRNKHKNVCALRHLYNEEVE